MCAISCRPSSSSHRRPLLRLLVCRDRAIGATLGARGGGANMGELLKHKQRTHTPENHVRGLPGLRLRPPSCAPGSVGMTRGGVGVCEVAGRLNRGFYNDCEKSPPSPQALMSWRAGARVSKCCTITIKTVVLRIQYTQVYGNFNTGISIYMQSSYI